MKVADQKVYLDGVNVAKKAVKWEWFKDKILPLDISNVMYYLKDKKQAVRVWFEVIKNKKVRKAKKADIVL
jgi:ribosomal protein L24